MDAFEEVFKHMPEFRIIVCRTCQFAVVPDQVYTHLQKRHPKMSTSLRRSIAATCRDLSDVARSAEEVVLPDPGEESVLGLKVYYNGI